MDTTSSNTPELPVGDLLDRYLAGEASAAERLALEARITQSSQMSARLGNPAAYATPDATANPVSLEEGWKQLLGRVNAAQSSRQILSTSRSDSASRRWWYGAVVGVSTACMIGAGVLFLSGRTGEFREEAHAVRSFSTVAGQHATVHLADGTTAILGPATTLDVTTNQNSGETQVTLLGQAQFTVVHKSHAAFVVRTGYSQTRVLGTTFFVRQYATDQDARIVVVDGRVAVQHVQDSLPAGARTILDGKMRGIVTDSGSVTVTPNISVKNYAGWLHGDLTFEEAPVREIVADLARAYGADIQVADSSLAGRRFTWTVPTRKTSLAEALDELTTMLGAHVQVSGRRVTLVPGRRLSKRTLPPHFPLSQESRYGI